MIGCKRQERILEESLEKVFYEEEVMIGIKGMNMPENCAKCPCLYIDYRGWHCGTPEGEKHKICQDSLYFPQRPKWCPIVELNNGKT